MRNVQIMMEKARNAFICNRADSKKTLEIRTDVGIQPPTVIQ